jgi:hypothetical protein
VLALAALLMGVPRALTLDRRWSALGLQASW